ncbi:hypothetical protein [Actinomadura sp. GTD37]|uniref:hypothetical protein n=1 Tax=Actinomadura sp. GTD37 TaxID=1778030 RepID=UPI0035C175D5
MPSVPPLPVRRVAIPIALAALLAPLGAPGALAAAPNGVELDAVVESLTENGGLYIAPGVRDLSDGQLDKLREPLERAHLPVYIAIFPAGTLPARTTAYNRLIADIYQEVKRKGTYAVVVGKTVRAYSWSVSPGTTRKAWAGAKKNGGGSLVNELSLFARSAGAAAPGKPGPGPDIGAESPVATPPPEPDDKAATDPGSASVPVDDEGGIPLGLIGGGAAVVAVAAGGAVFLLRRKRRPAVAPAGGPAPASGGPGRPGGPGGPGGPAGTPGPDSPAGPAGPGAAAQAPQTPQGPQAPPAPPAPPAPLTPPTPGAAPSDAPRPGGPSSGGPATGDDRPPTV